MRNRNDRSYPAVDYPDWIVLPQNRSRSLRWWIRFIGIPRTRTRTAAFLAHTSATPRCSSDWAVHPRPRPLYGYLHWIPSGRCARSSSRDRRHLPAVLLLCGAARACAVPPAEVLLDRRIPRFGECLRRGAHGGRYLPPCSRCFARMAVMGDRAGLASRTVALED